MQATFEWTIQELLKKHKNKSQVIDESLKTWEQRGFEKKSSEYLFRFLKNAGYDLTLCAQLKKMCLQKINTDWLFFLKLCQENNVVLKEDILQFITNQLSEKKLTDIFKYTDICYTYPSLDALKEQYETKELAQTIKEKKKLLKKLEVLKQERLLDEEAKLIKRLSFLYPNDKKTEAAKKDFDKRNANRIFSKSKKLQHNKYDYLETVATGESEYEKQMYQLARDNKDLSYLIATSLCMSEAYSTAIKILKQSNLKAEEKWLYLELLHRTKQYVVGLDLARKMEQDYISSPASMVNCIYYQAQFLYGLGKVKEAISCLDTVLSFDASFRIANELRTEWSTT